MRTSAPRAPERLARMSIDIPSPPAVSSAKGAITLARHGEPALSRRVRLDAAGYRRWWAAYEEGGILDGQTPPPALLELARRADVVFASPRRRALETADAVVAGGHFVRDPVFVEAPLPPPPWPRFVRLKPRTWGVIARTAWWFFGHHEGQETRAQAEARAARAVERLIGEAEGGRGREVLLLAHGFFNAMMARELKRRGWRQVAGAGDFTRYWQTRRFERV